MQLIEHQGEKLKKALRDRGITQEDFAISLGMTRGNLIHHMKKEVLDYDFVLKLRDKGYSGIVQSVVQKPADVQPSDTLALSDFISVYETGNLMHAPLVGQYAYAGYLSGFSDKEYMSELPKHPWIVDKGYKGNYVTFEVKGDSMDDGSSDAYKEGDLILCREVAQHLWQNKLHIAKWDFVIVTENGILLKKIIDHNITTGNITLHSLNEMYEDVIINISQVRQLFNVVKMERKR
jgi:SOS-response transcriptional repressor LexA